ncbi:eukaryotic translation initiation factor 4G-like [Helianthus annuus]|uniref:eukaryotic translation initiation factor 4G-like n=1 Tax=Helianthus annuus TaxID=4232 RepID=UPI000B8F8B02|nr:eukaryotic translation initiation factor 4G-like [Helianthus annuus]
MVHMFNRTPDASSTGGVVKPIDASVQKTTPGLPKAQPSNAVPLSSGTFGSGSSTPVKGSADASRAFPLQFGSISPSVINGMQARIDSLKAASSQNSDVPKQRLIWKLQ